jgi:transcriptional regulator with GAF, ATPase, and Fis domain
MRRHFVIIVRVQIETSALLRAIVRAERAEAVAGALTDAIATSRTVALIRVWLFGDDNRLALTSSAGTPSGGGSYRRLDGEFREMAVADATIQEIALSAQPFVVGGLRGDEAWLTNSAWAARQGVRTFLGFPLVADDRNAGVLAAFDRELPNDDLVAQLSLVTDIAACRIVQLRPMSARDGDQSSTRDQRTSHHDTVVLTRSDLRSIERDNIESALARTQGKVFGADGAAALLGMRPTTLASRIKALGITRSRTALRSVE